MPRIRIEPIYRPLDEGSCFLLFDGTLQFGDDELLVPAQVELEITPETKLRTHVLGPAAASARVSADANGEPELAVPNGADLAPPDPTVLSKRDGVSRAEFHLDQLRAGELGGVRKLLFQASGVLEVSPPSRQLADGGRQRQLDFTLPGWELVLVPGGGDAGLAALISATPTSPPPISTTDIDRLRRQLFILLSFLANREVGIGPICGLDGAETVVWAEWSLPRVKLGKPGVKWCPWLLTSAALPELANGLASVATDPDLEVIIDRAIGYSLAANGEEVIEVRIPIVCSGLELLAWAVLQREDWLIDLDSRRRLGTAASVRLLLKWAGIPTAVPSGLSHLESRLSASGQPGWEGPEILFNLRNAMVHPPRHLTNAEWPEGEELVDAWLLGTWYLELALLRVLGYRGEYWSRVRLNRPAADLEPVPWAFED